MLKKNLHIVLSLFLVITTTTSVWSQFLAAEVNPIEVKSEKKGETDSEEGEKEKESDDLDDDIFHGKFQASPLSLFLKDFGSLYLAEGNRASNTKLYLRYHRLKIAC